MDSSTSAPTSQQHSNVITLDMEALVPGMNRREADNTNNLPHPRGINRPHHSARRRRIPHVRKSTKATSSTHTKANALKHNKACFPLVDDGIDDILIEVDYIDVTRCEEAKDIQEAIDSATSIYMTRKELTGDFGER